MAVSERKIKCLIEFRTNFLRSVNSDPLKTGLVVWDTEANSSYYVCILEGQKNTPLFTTVTKNPTRRYYEFFLFGSWIEDEYRLLLLELALSESPPILRVVMGYKSRKEAISKELEIFQNLLHLGIKTFNKKPIQYQHNNHWEVNLIKAHDKGVAAFNMGCSSTDNPYVKTKYRDAWADGFNASCSNCKNS